MVAEQVAEKMQQEEAVEKIRASLGGVGGVRSWRNFGRNAGCQLCAYVETNKVEILAEAERLKKESEEAWRLQAEAAALRMEIERARLETERLDHNRVALARIESAVGQAQRILRVHFDGEISQDAAARLVFMIMNTTQGILEDTE